MTGICFCRSDFSIGESMLKVEQIANIAKSKNYSAVCLCDTMTLSSMIEAAQACAKKDLKLISGVRLRVVEDATVKDKDQNKRAWYPKIYFKNENGLKIGYKLLSQAFEPDNFYYLPRLSFSHLLDAVTDDIVVSIGDQYSHLGTKLLDERIEMLKNKIGAENIVAECIPFNTPVFDRLTKESLCTAQKHGLKLIFSDLCFYREAKNKKSLIALSAIASKFESTKVTDKFINKPHYDTAYIKDFEEYLKLCKEQLVRITDRYGIDVTELKKAVQYSVLEFEKQFTYEWKGLEPCLPQMADDPFETLKELCKQGFRERLTKPIYGYQPKPEDLQKYVDRLTYELDIIKKLNFSNYFLLVRDILQWASQNGLGGSAGRGSSGSSLIAFLLGIVETDPIRFGLMFERFINPSRNDLPDVDMDISSERRQELINHIIDKYGTENVASISNYITMGASGVIRACGRVFGLPIKEYSCSTKIGAEHGISDDLRESVAKIPEVELFATKYPEVWETALDLEGCIYTYGVHAAGLIVAGEPLSNRAAVENRSGTKVVCWDKRVVESMGLIKMDLLGLKTLDTLNLAKQYVKDNFNVDLDFLQIPLDDEKTLQLFSEGKTSGVFQFETAGSLLKKLAVCEKLTFEDLTAATALNRPGPMDSGMLGDYIAIKQGVKDECYEYPQLKEVLKETKGLIVYQEQVMKTAMILAGFTASEADGLRKAMGKKDLKKMQTYKQKWMEGCESVGGLTPYQADTLWNKIEAFAAYGFNKSHAVEYTLLSYASMYVKAHYPTAFYSATLSISPEDKLRNIVKDAESDGISVLPPDINLAGDNFKIIDEKSIMIPFNRIKGIGPTAVKAILDARESGKFTSIADFESRVTGKCNVRHRGWLNEVGAFASIEPTQVSSTDITRLKAQYELLPGLVIKTLKSNKKISSVDVKKELDKNNNLGKDLLDPLGKTYVKPYCGRTVRYVVIFDAPNKTDLATGKFAAARQFEAISSSLYTAGLNKEEGYWTGLMKTAKENKELTTQELALNLPLLQRELQLLKPEIIVLMGPDTIRQFIKDIKKPSEMIGQSFYDPEYDTTFIIGMNPAQIFFKPEKQKDLDEVFQKVATMIH